MNSLTELLIAALVLGGVAVYLSSMAGRLDRLHHRIEATYAGLDAQLLRRVAATQDLSASGLLDPASSLLMSASAQDALTADPDGPARLQAESDLTHTLGAVFAEPDDVAAVVEAGAPDDAIAAQMVDELAVACRRVELARRFHNDVVRSCLQLRRKRVVRWFRLAGHTPLPVTADFDDTVPAGLAGR
jgi:hypothetical protein